MFFNTLSGFLLGIALLLLGIELFINVPMNGGWKPLYFHMSKSDIIFYGIILSIIISQLGQIFISPYLHWWVSGIICLIAIILIIYRGNITRVLFTQND